MNDLPTKWLCLVLCTLAVALILGAVWIVAKNDRPGGPDA